jgi:O-acetyl-ADP-ribose deacetylase (regulator of RNase III)
MIHYTTGDILANDHLCDALVNPVNCIGVAGKGLALQFRKAYPDAFKAYALACTTGKVKVGHVYVAQISNMFYPRWLVHFPTKQHWRDPSKLEWITEGLVALRHTIEAKEIESVAVPALGCGLGGLRWEDVRREIEAVLGNVEAEVWVYEPGSDIGERP